MQGITHIVILGALFAWWYQHNRYFDPIIALLVSRHWAVACGAATNPGKFLFRHSAGHPISLSGWGTLLNWNSGEQGFFEKIGWRSTWIPMLPNNVVKSCPIVCYKGVKVESLLIPGKTSFPFSWCWGPLQRLISDALLSASHSKSAKGNSEIHK